MFPNLTLILFFFFFTKILHYYCIVIFGFLNCNKEKTEAHLINIDYVTAIIAAASFVVALCRCLLFYMSFKSSNSLTCAVY